MKLDKFFHKVFLRQLEEKANSENIVLGISHTHFTEGHRVGYGRNGASRLLQFTTEHLELESIRFERCGKSPSDARHLDIYAYSDVKPGQGCQEDYVRVQFKNSPTSKHVSGSYDGTDLKSSLVRQACQKAIADLKAEGVTVANEDKFIEEKSERVERDMRYDLLAAGKETGERKAQAIAKINERYGVLIVDVYTYNVHFNFIPVKYVKETKNGLEIGYRTFATYNSLPGTLTLHMKPVKDKYNAKPIFKTVSLKEMGVERSGYYNHHDRMEVTPDQVAAVKKFNSQFISKEKRAK